MRHLKDSPLSRRAALLVACAIVFALVAVPTMALAATPHSTISTTYMYMPKAKAFTIAGRISASTHGKYMTIEIRKPGRTFWTPVASAKISTSGRWSVKYTPKLGGKFLIRARYGTTAAGLSRTATVIVRKGPGTRTEIVLASTTSTKDSGLFEALLPMFYAQNPEYKIKATFVGSGAAIHLGLDGNADVVLAHSPAAELEALNGIYTSKGVQSTHLIKAIRRYKVMYNDYVLVGPNDNPAGVNLTLDTPQAAFGKIAAAAEPFLSRNDASGTNSKEIAIWKLAGDPQKAAGASSWYTASGTLAMGQALNQASEQGAYTLADYATWMNWRNMAPDYIVGGVTQLDENGYPIKVTDIKIVNAGSATYFNQYSVMEVSKPRNWEGARDFSLWIRSAGIQAMIGEYGKSTFGQALFKPNQGSY